MAMGEAIPNCFKHIYEQRDQPFAQKTLEGINMLLQMLLASIKKNKETQGGDAQLKEKPFEMDDFNPDQDDED
jgi:hypothetical protein